MNNTIKIAIALECAAKYRETGGNDLMTAVVELRRLAAAERELEALKASIGEPVAWRYKDSRGNYRYCGYKTGFDTEHPLLKPIPLYALTKDKP